MTVSRLALASALTLAGPALADLALPEPHLSRALDAVLLPIDDGVREGFALDPADEGLLVLATAPGGIADANGIEPGDILAMVEGEAVADPELLDEWVWEWILAGSGALAWEVWRAGETVEVVTVVTEAEYWEVVEVASVASWSSWTVEGWSYEEWVVSYEEEITESYEEYSEEYEEVSEEYSEEVSEEEVSEEDYSEEVSEEEESYEEEVEEEEAEEEVEDEGGEEDYGDEGGDEGGGDE
jgi:C-terminal processing protease CtpA/Prc